MASGEPDLPSMTSARPDSASNTARRARASSFLKHHSAHRGVKASRTIPIMSNMPTSKTLRVRSLDHDTRQSPSADTATPSTGPGCAWGPKGHVVGALPNAAQHTWVKSMAPALTL